MFQHEMRLLICSSASFRKKFVSYRAKKKKYKNRFDLLVAKLESISLSEKKTQNLCSNAMRIPKDEKLIVEDGTISIKEFENKLKLFETFYYKKNP